MNPANRFTDPQAHADPSPAKRDLNVLALVKGEERYIFLIEDTPASKAEALRVLGRWASDKELSFTWYDAAVMSQRIRNPTPIVEG